MKYKKIEDAIERLEEIAFLEGTELGEAWQILVDIKNYSYCFSRDFNIAVINEIFKQAEESHENFDIVEEEEEIKPRKTKVLKRKNE